MSAICPALVHFEGGLPEGYSAVELADPSFSIVQGIQVVMIGYGVTDGLNNEGAGVLRQTETTVIGQISDTQYVTDGRATSVCFGDSGWPGLRCSRWGLCAVGHCELGLKTKGGAIKLRFIRQ